MNLDVDSPPTFWYTCLVRSHEAGSGPVGRSIALMAMVFKILLYGIHFIVSIVLIALVVSQTNKSEGLGFVGGSGAGSGASPRGRAGMDEKLDEYTKYTAVVFMLLSTLLYLMATKYHWG